MWGAWNRKNRRQRGREPFVVYPFCGGEDLAYILIVDDESRMRQLLSIMLERRGHRIAQAGDGEEAFRMIQDVAYDMVITDIKMPRMDGMELLEKIEQKDIPCPVVFITAFATVDSAVEAMHQGAVDYITKPFEEERILFTIERTLKLGRTISENRALKEELQKVTGSGDVVYASKAMSKVMDLALRVARTESAVLITGESGTGKEVIARFIHQSSPYREGRFVPVNCAAISPSLVESELFGHEKGSFTSADKKGIGKFEYASGGTLFLDEIGDLPGEAQAKLLRALQEKKIQRVGGNEEIPVDVRVICATNRNLKKLVDGKIFRKDLFYRINVFPIEPPPLRERVDDIPLLVDHFLAKIGRGQKIHMTEGALRVMMAYPWPGNVRELINAVERAAILAGDGGAITVDTLSFLRSGSSEPDRMSSFKIPPEGIVIEELENDLVNQALEMTGSNQTAAAKLLGLSRAKFRVLMKQASKENR